MPLSLHSMDPCCLWCALVLSVISLPGNSLSTDCQLGLESGEQSIGHSRGFFLFLFIYFNLFFFGFFTLLFCFLCFPSQIFTYTNEINTHFQTRELRNHTDRAQMFLSHFALEEIHFFFLISYCLGQRHDPSWVLDTELWILITWALWKSNYLSGSLIVFFSGQF